MSKPGPDAEEKTNQKASGSKRKSFRHNRRLKALWRVMGARDLRFTPVTVQDISRHGVALLVETALKTGAILSIEFPGVAEKFAGPWLAVAENVRPVYSERWVLGCAFSTAFAEADLRALLASACQPPLAQSGIVAPPSPTAQPVADPFLQGSAKERRAAVRRGGQRVAVLIARRNALAVRIPGAVTDRSLGGLGLAVPCPMLLGTLIKIRAVQVDDRTPWTSARVTSCRSSGRQWILGCQFTSSLPSSVLLSFC